MESDLIQAEEQCDNCKTRLDDRFARYRLSNRKVICVPCKMKEVLLNKIELYEPLH